MSRTRDSAGSDSQRARRSYHRRREPGRSVVSEECGSMVYVITEGCIDVMDRTCVQECPVDCIYEGARALYINPEECIDCGACEPVCPREAIYYEEDLPENLTHLSA